MTAAAVAAPLALKAVSFDPAPASVPVVPAEPPQTVAPAEGRLIVTRDIDDGAGRPGVGNIGPAPDGSTTGSESIGVAPETDGGFGQSDLPVDTGPARETPAAPSTDAPLATTSPSSALEVTTTVPGSDNPTTGVTSDPSTSDSSSTSSTAPEDGDTATSTPSSSTSTSVDASGGTDETSTTTAVDGEDTTSSLFVGVEGGARIPDSD